MPNFAQIGNDLYTGKRSIDFIGRQKTWYAVSAVLIVLALLGIFARGLNFGIEFRGGSEYRVSGVSTTQGYEDKARGAISQAGIQGNIVTTVIGGSSVRVQTEAAGDKNEAAKNDLAQAFGVPTTNVSASLIGPSWGQSVSSKAIQALVVFLILVSLVMAAYFRTWKMALSGLVALIHDLIITVGIYALFGFEITPSSMIGFLTILGYSLYDTVVVFDKVRENTAEAFLSRRRTYTQAANLAVNQTLVRSVNTTVVALLPIAAILVVGFTLLGPGTLLDLSLALFVGIAVGAYSSIFIATPLLVDLRRSEKAVAGPRQGRPAHPGQGRGQAGDRPRRRPAAAARPAAPPRPARPRPRSSTARDAAGRRRRRRRCRPGRGRRTDAVTDGSSRRRASGAGPRGAQVGRQGSAQPAEPAAEVEALAGERTPDRRAGPQPDPRHPRLPAAGHPVQGLHPAAGRRRRRSRRSSTTSPAGMRVASTPWWGSRPAASSSGRRWPTAWASASCRCARRASCPGRRCVRSTPSSTAAPSLEMHRDALAPGERTLVVDDVLATGGTVAATCRLVEGTGATVTGIDVVLELTFLRGREQVGDYDLHAIVAL